MTSGRFAGTVVDAREKVLALLRRYGWNATSFQILEAGFSYWFAGDDACVAYVDTGAAWVAAGAPIAAPARAGDVAYAFAAQAAAAHRRVGFFATEARFAALVPSYPALHIGEQAVWDPQKWPQSLAASRGLREQLRRARAKGVEVRALGAEDVRDGAPTRMAIDALIARWLAAKPMAPMGFLVDVQAFAFPDERRYFAAERGGVIVGFLAAVPVYARGGWLFEDLMRDPAAPNGSAELLIDAAMHAVAAEGSRYATLGLAPLAGVRGWLRLVRNWSAAIYDFDGVRAFKAKLRPHHWEAISLAVPHGTSLNLVLYDVLSAFAHGSFARFGLRTLLRGPALVVRALAALLVPWTVALALAPNAQWFPWPWVKWGWVGFDAVLTVSLLSLAAQWRRWLGAALAIAVSADAALTIAEASVFNVPRAQSVLDGTIIAAACAAPTVAAAILWSALARRD